jgi:hypothetical protein
LVGWWPPWFWAPELKAYGPFTIWTDHKNLEWFIVKRQLSERQIRWYETLTQFQFTLTYRPGAEAILPDALSRREQDTLGEDDKLLRFRRFLEPDRAPNWPGSEGGKTVLVATTPIQMMAIQFNATGSQEAPIADTFQTESSDSSVVDIFQNDDLDDHGITSNSTTGQETPTTDAIQTVSEDSDPDTPFQDGELNDL